MTEYRTLSTSATANSGGAAARMAAILERLRPLVKGRPPHGPAHGLAAADARIAKARARHAARKAERKAALAAPPAPAP